MKKIILLSISIMLALSAVAQTQNEAYLAYIKKYYKQAQAEQKKYGIPASITLAQGLLESGAGRGELATKGNNHFGIKCAGGWTGETILKDDDKKNDCFRKYNSASESFEDHSKFLLRDRYKSLFELEPTDYKGWAYGLKQCGYATDPGYATKLIKLIEDYNLMQYDVASSTSKTNQSSKTASTKSNNKNNTTEPKTIARKTTTNAKEEEESDVVTNTFKTKSSRKNMSNVDLVNEHKLYRNNGSYYIIARQGDTFASIAYEYNIYEKTLRRYNDIVNTRYELKEGDKVYLYPKRFKAASRYARYRVKKGEDIWQIAQDKGMRLKSIYKLNGIQEGQNVTVNQDLRLR